MWCRLSKQITLLVEREIHDKKFSAHVAHASSLIAPNKGFGRMNGAPANFQQKTEHGKYIHTTFLSGKFLPFSEMYTVNKEVLKRSSGFFPTYIPHCKINTCTYIHVFRIPCSNKIEHFSFSNQDIIKVKGYIFVAYMCTYNVVQSF